MFDIPLYRLAEDVLKACRQAGLRLGTVESCTGGLVAALLTEVPGASDVFLGGLVTYDNAIKRALAHVPESLLLRHGAVSEEVACAMAEGGRTAMGTDIAVSLTGIAGPGGGSAEKPVGLVYVAVSSSGGTECRRWQFKGDRPAIRLHAVEAALTMIHEILRP